MMKTVRKGSRGRDVRFLQIVLNTHLPQPPKLKVDGVFGAKTETRTQAFQKHAGLTTDGIVGPKTWAELLASAKVPAPNLKKFRGELGTALDFVNHIRDLETRHRDAGSLLENVSNFARTTSGARYLLSRKPPHVIDFRHFFAAASEAYSGSVSRKTNAPIGGTRGNALLLGVANELAQCVDEGLRSKLNSCFSREDLGSNRLGAEFGRALLISKASARSEPVHRQLQTFLTRVAPQPPKAIGNTELPGAGNVALESLSAIAVGILDFLVPDAY